MLLNTADAVYLGDVGPHDLGTWEWGGTVGTPGTVGYMNMTSGPWLTLRLGTNKEGVNFAPGGVLVPWLAAATTIVLEGVEYTLLAPPSWSSTNQSISVQVDKALSPTMPGHPAGTVVRLGTTGHPVRRVFLGATQVWPAPLPAPVTGTWLMMPRGYGTTAADHGQALLSMYNGRSTLMLGVKDTSGADLLTPFATAQVRVKVEPTGGAPFSLDVTVASAATGLRLEASLSDAQALLLGAWPAGVEARVTVGAATDVPAPEVLALPFVTLHDGDVAGLAAGLYVDARSLPAGRHVVAVTPVGATTYTYERAAPQPAWSEAIVAGDHAAHVRFNTLPASGSSWGEVWWLIGVPVFAEYDAASGALLLTGLEPVKPFAIFTAGQGSGNAQAPEDGHAAFFNTRHALVLGLTDMLGKAVTPADLPSGAHVTMRPLTQGMKAAGKTATVDVASTSQNGRTEFTTTPRMSASTFGMTSSAVYGMYVEAPAAPPPPPPPVPDQGWAKADIVNWLLANGVTYTKKALGLMTKAELLVAVEHLLNPDVEP